MAKPCEIFCHPSHFYNLKQKQCGNYVGKSGASQASRAPLGEGISAEICNSDPIDQGGYPCGWGHSRPRFFLRLLFCPLFF